MDAKWIFFDVGSTLVDETEAYDHRAREMIEKTDISFSVFDDKRIELAKQGFDGNSEAIKYFGLKKTPWHTEDEIPFEDALDTLKKLKERGYKLGIIANQSAGTAQRLENWGLLKYFDVVAASAELGIAKPDRLIFENSTMIDNTNYNNWHLIAKLTDESLLGVPGVSDSLCKYKVRAVLQNHSDFYALIYEERTGLYSFPGGSVEENEDILTALKREVREETGCSCDEIKELGYIDNDFVLNIA